MAHRWRAAVGAVAALAALAALASETASAAVPAPPTGFTLTWSDDFAGAANTGVNTGNWLYDTGTCYPGCPAADWGTGEVETMSSSTANVHQDGAGHLLITPIRSGSSCSGRGRARPGRRPSPSTLASGR
jgi:hypothetical protein